MIQRQIELNENTETAQLTRISDLKGHLILYSFPLQCVEENEQDTQFGMNTMKNDETRRIVRTEKIKTNHIMMLAINYRQLYYGQ